MFIPWKSRELERIDGDHPEAMTLPISEWHRRYWMYSAELVARARAQVRLNRLAAPIVGLLEHVADRLTKLLNRKDEQ